MINIKFEHISYSESLCYPTISDLIMVEDMTKDYSYLMSGANQDMEFTMMFSAVVHNIAADRLNAMGTDTLPLAVSNECICMPVEMFE